MEIIPAATGNCSSMQMFGTTDAKRPACFKTKDIFERHHIYIKGSAERNESFKPLCL